jgi:hypothetical protein
LDGNDHGSCVLVPRGRVLALECGDVAGLEKTSR